MNFLQSIRTCFKKYAVFKGRATRSEFWWFQLFYIGLGLVLIAIDLLVLGNGLSDENTPSLRVGEIFMLLPLAAVTARRLHDIGCSGWWQLPTFLTYLSDFDVSVPTGFASNVINVSENFGLIFSLVLLLFLIKNTVPITNQYGPNPKNPDMDSVFN